MTKRTLARLLVSGGGIGYAPLAPGTVGSLAGLAVFWMVKDCFWSQILFLVSVYVIAFWGIKEGSFPEQDDRRIVIDEIGGIFICFLGVKPFPWFYPAGFFLFRFFDIIKVFPGRRIERMPGAGGVMLDDAAAALYTNAILRLLGLLLRT